MLGRVVRHVVKIPTRLSRLHERVVPAAEIRRQRECSYVLIVAEGPPQMVKEIERRIRVTDGILKFITVRVDEELRKAERRKSRRAAEDEKRRARGLTRPAPAAADSEEVSL